MDVDNGPDVACFERRVAKILGENDGIVFADQRPDLARGYAVMRRGAISPASTCHTDLIHGLRPSGAITSPSTSYRTPNAVFVIDATG
jgi:hypothetical protein